MGLKSRGEIICLQLASCDGGEGQLLAMVRDPVRVKDMQECSQPPIDLQCKSQAVSDRRGNGVNSKRTGRIEQSALVGSPVSKSEAPL